MTEEDISLEQRLRELAERAKAQSPDGADVNPELAIQSLVIGSKNEIFVWNEHLNQPIKIAERKNEVSDLCYHDGRLYDASLPPAWYKIISGYISLIFDTLSDEEIGVREGFTYSLCSHLGRLYDGGTYGIKDTFANKEVGKPRIKDGPYGSLIYIFGPDIRDRINRVSGLCSHNGGIYYSLPSLTNMGNICSHDGLLYYTCGLLGGSIAESTSKKKIASKRGIGIFGLCSHNGKLYDGGYYGLYDTFANNKVLDIHVRALASVPGHLAQKLLSRAENV